MSNDYFEAALEHLVEKSAAQARKRKEKEAANPVATHGAEAIAAMEIRVRKQGQENLQHMDAYTDSWTAELVGYEFRDSLCWTPGRGWLHYGMGVWSGVSDKTVQELVRWFLKSHWKERAVAEDASEYVLRQLLKLNNATFIRNVFGLLGGLLEVSDDIFDRDLDLLCVGNGVVNLKTGALGAWSAGHHMTRKTNVEYHPARQHADLWKALEALPDTDEVMWLQARFGQAATGHMAPANAGLVIANGGGANGKSTIFQAVKDALGAYAAVIPEQVITAKEGAHPTELTTLMGVRMALIEETPEGKYLPTKRLKSLAGDPEMSARRMYGNFITWKATHSLFVTTNYRPLVSEVDHGTWRRLALITFPLRFKPAHQELERDTDRHGDPGLDERLRTGKAQQEAVLAWIVEGAVKRQDRYAKLPERIEQDTKAWQADTDLLTAFLTEATVFDGDGMVAAQELFEEFKYFVEARGHRGWTEQTFASRLTSHPDLEKYEIEKKRTRKVADISRRSTLAPPYSVTQIQVWEGLRWKDSAPSYVPVQGVQAPEKLSSREQL